jgi:DNA-binding MarR family transcriptional regulator
MGQDDVVPDTSSLAVHELVVVLDRAADVLLANRYAISHPRFMVLRALRIGGTATQHALAGRLGITDAAVSRMLPGLADAGLLTVADDPGHGRRRLVTLTDQGEKLARECELALDAAFTGAATDAGVDIEKFMHGARALTKQVRASMKFGPTSHGESE